MANQWIERSPIDKAMRDFSTYGLFLVPMIPIIPMVCQQTTVMFVISVILDMLY